MDLLVDSLTILWRLDVLLALIVGSVGGVVIGAIPGVGPAVAIAILLPATFSLEPIVGLTALLGIYGSSMYGGAIPAILINTPGTAVNALTTYEGTPMTPRGEGRRALALAYSASFFGGVFSVACLILFAPLLARIALHFGSREIFLAALLGLVLVVLAHRGRVMAAGMMASLGVFLNTVGLEPIQYSQRFTFGQGWLSGGINLIVVVLGLFAISQAFILLRSDDDGQRPGAVGGGIFGGFRELLRYKRVAALVGNRRVYGDDSRCRGIHGPVSQLYVGAPAIVRTGKFWQWIARGSGGVGGGKQRGAGSGDDSLLALGIPGEALTAMMLSVLYVHNVVPGPQLFQGQMDFVIALYLALLILNILVLVFLLISTDLLLRLLAIPKRFLGVTILALSFVGVYSLRNSATDCAIGAVFGLFGYVLKRLEVPIVPIILGMVLGGIMETKLRTSMMRVDTPFDFINRPIAFILFALILIVLASQIYNVVRP